MGFLVDKLNWAPNRIDGTPRSLLAMIIDPVGACFQPADLHPFQWAVNKVQREQEEREQRQYQTAQEDTIAESLKDSEEEAKVVETPPVSPILEAPAAVVEKSSA